MKFSRLGLPILAAALTWSVGSAALAAPGKCDLEGIRAIAPADAVIDKVTPVKAPVAHCEVLGHITTTNPGPNRVEFSVMLPDEGFGNRFYFIGLGAAAGVVPTAQVGNPLNTGYIGATLKLLSNGFAVSGSDTGHKGMMWDFGIDNPAARLDHSHRGAHVSTVAAQAITKAYYGMNDKLYRYHLGCSGGGRMGAKAIHHHPTDYDAAVISTGVGPGHGHWFPWIIQYLVKNPDAWVSPAKLASLERRVIEVCGGPDGLVRDPDACGFKPETMLCKGADSDECLTAKEITMVKRIVDRFPDGKGTTSPGFTLAMPTAWSSFLLGNTRPTNMGVENPWAPNPPPPSYGLGQSILRGFYFNDAKFNMVTDLDYNDPADMQKLTDGNGQLGVLGTDFDAFKKAGGKMIIWAGIAENAVPPGTEIEFYHDMKKRYGAGLDDFMRLYLAPGVLHCGGGPGPQDTTERFLDKAIAWVEEGKAPTTIIASSNPTRISMPPPGQPAPPLIAPPSTRTVLLCPYPQTAVFSARKGAFPYDAENWTCK